MASETTLVFSSLVFSSSANVSCGRRLAGAMCTLLLTTADITIATLCLCLPPGSSFHHPSIAELLQSFAGLLPENFDIRTLVADFWLISLMRTSVTFGALIGVIMRSRSYRERDVNNRLRLAQTIVNYSLLLIATYSPIKLLLYDEYNQKCDDVRFWFCFGTNIGLCASTYFVWNTLLNCVLPFAIDEDDVDSESETTSIVEDTESDTAPLTQSNQSNDRSNRNSDKKAKKSRSKSDKENEDDDDDDVAVSTTASIRLLWRLLGYCRAQWHYFALGFFSLVIYSAATTFIPLYTGQAIATILISRSYDQLRHSVLIVFLLSGASAVFGGFRGGCFSYAIYRMVREVRCDLFTSLVNQDIGFFDKTKTGSITSRLTADCQTMSDTVGLNVNVFLRNLIMMIGGLVIMFRLSWQMCLVTLVAFPFVTVVSQIYGAYYDRLSKEVQDNLAKANEVAEEVISSMRTVRSFANEHSEAARYRESHTTVLGGQRKQTFAYMGYIWTNDGFDMLLTVVALWYGGHLVLSGRLESKDLLSFLLYQLQLGDNLQSMGYVWTGLMQSVGASRKVFEYIDRPPAFPTDGTLTNTNLSGHIEFKNVKFAYPTRPKAEVLQGISFSVKPGETVALVGPSGGGKSSCISLLEHFYEPLSGHVTVDGRSVAEYDHRFLHRIVSLVSQEPVLYGRKVSENIVYGLDDLKFTPEDIQSVARLANAHDFVSEMPGGYDTQVGEKGVQLSGGQKQRIAIARALIRKPKILLLDEATSALDAESEHLVQEAIYAALSGHTVLLIAHRLSTVERADRIVVIDKGRVVQTGSHAQLLQTDGMYRQLVQRQLLGGAGATIANNKSQSKQRVESKNSGKTSDGSRNSGAHTPISIAGSSTSFRSVSSSPPSVTP